MYKYTTSEPKHRSNQGLFWAFGEVSVKKNALTPDVPARQDAGCGSSTAFLGEAAAAAFFGEMGVSKQLQALFESPCNKDYTVFGVYIRAPDFVETPMCQVLHTICHIL